MACNNTLSLPRGASLDLLARMPSLFADGHFAGWQLDAQVRTRAGELVAALGVAWTDAAATRHLRLTCQDTSAWPVAPVQFDVRLTSPAGDAIYTRAVTIFITQSSTRTLTP